MSLLFNMLSWLVITFLPRSKSFFFFYISWLLSPSVVILEPKKIVSHCFHCFPISIYLPFFTVVKTLPAIQEMKDTWVRSLGRKESWRRKWQPIPAFLPRESHGQRQLARYSPWGRKESDMIEGLTLSNL